MKKHKQNSKKTKRRVFKQLTLDDRIKIEIRYRDGWSLREIAKCLGNGRTASSVSREIAGKPRRGIGKYQARINHEKALDERIGKKELKLKNNLIRDYVAEKLKLGWSPEQISLRLPIDHPDQTISHEAIYKYIYGQIHRGGNGLVKKNCEDLRKYLPRRHKRRQTKGFRKAQKLERSVLPSIENRPKEADKRKTVGHWEDDTIVSRQSLVRIKSINERASGVVFLGKMINGTSEESSRVVCEKLSSVPSPFRKTLTRDRGTENIGYEEIENKLNLSCFFAHSYCSYERGSNENLNGLVRRFYPKKTDFAGVSDDELRKVEFLLNTRPRKRFGGKTPLEVLFEKTGVAINY
ncbi:MAG: IS30 family transposase [Patescibacteria group bacterium]